MKRRGRGQTGKKVSLPISAPFLARFAIPLEDDDCADDGRRRVSEESWAYD